MCISCEEASSNPIIAGGKTDEKNVSNRENKKLRTF